jgi:hypothetical protein
VSSDLTESKIKELDDYRKIWDYGKIEYRCCHHEVVATFRFDAKELECPKCGKMTKFLRLDFPPHKPF